MTLMKLRRVRAAKEKGTWPNIMLRCLIWEGKLLVKASATMRWVRRGTSLTTPAATISRTK